MAVGGAQRGTSAAPRRYGARGLTMAGVMAPECSAQCVVSYST